GAKPGLLRHVRRVWTRGEPPRREPRHLRDELGQAVAAARRLDLSRAGALLSEPGEALRWLRAAAPGPGAGRPAARACVHVGGPAPLRGHGRRLNTATARTRPPLEPGRRSIEPLEELDRAA